MRARKDHYFMDGSTWHALLSWLFGTGLKPGDSHLHLTYYPAGFLPISPIYRDGKKIPKE